MNFNRFYREWHREKSERIKRALSVGSLYLSRASAIELQIENGMTRAQAEEWADSLPTDTEQEPTP